MFLLRAASPKDKMIDLFLVKFLAFEEFLFIYFTLSLLAIELPKTSIILVSRVDDHPWVIWGLLQKPPIF